MSINQQITSAPPAPQRSDPNTFADKADAFVVWLEKLDDELNTWADQANSTTDEVNQNASNAKVYRNESYKWANEEEDTSISDSAGHSGYSAYHYAKKAETFYSQTVTSQLWIATSNTSIEVGTGSKTFTLNEENRSFNIGSKLRIVAAFDPVNVWMEGVVTDYTDNNLTVIIGSANGSGTYSDWKISLNAGSDTSTVNGYTTSQTPEINKIVVSKSDGKIALDWLPTGVLSKAGVTITSIPAGQSCQLDDNFLQVISAASNSCKLILPDATTQAEGRLTYLIKNQGKCPVYLYNKNESGIVGILYPGKFYLVVPQDTTDDNGYWECCEADEAQAPYVADTIKTVFNSGYTYYISATTLSNDNVLIAYRNDGNSSYGTFCIYDKDGNQVVAPTVFNSAGTTDISATTLSNDNVLIAYKDGGNSSYGTFCIYDKDGNQVVAPTVFNSADTNNISATTLSNDNVLIAYRNDGNSGYGTFCIYDKDGNQVVAPTVFNSASTVYISATTLSNDNVLIAYRNYGNSSYGTFCIYDKDGNQVVAPTVFNSATTYYISTTTLSDDNVLIAYEDGGNSNYGTFCIYDKDGNQVVAPTVFNSASTIYISATTLSNDNVLIAYKDGGNSNYGTFCIYDKDGNQVVAPTVFNSADTAYISATTLSNDNVLIAYKDGGNSNYGTFKFIYKGQR